MVAVAWGAGERLVPAELKSTLVARGPFAAMTAEAADATIMIATPESRATPPMVTSLFVPVVLGPFLGWRVLVGRR